MFILFENIIFKIKFHTEDCTVKNQQNETLKEKLKTISNGYYHFVHLLHSPSFGFSFVHPLHHHYTSLDFSRTSKKTLQRPIILI